MTELVHPEKKKKSNKLLYWYFGICAAIALISPDEIIRTILIVSGVGIALIGAYKYKKFKKKLEPENKEAIRVTKLYNRKVGEATHLTDASLAQGDRAFNTKTRAERQDAEEYEVIFADAAGRTAVRLNPRPPKLIKKMDRLRKR